jgi:predicted NUDIX family phosphoesterase
MKFEQVLAVKTTEALGLVQGTMTEIPDGGYLNKLFSPADVILGSRAWLENDEDYLQLIPYTLVTSENGNVLAYSRTDKTGEGRLSEKVSVGFGGHINVGDCTGEDIIDIDNSVVYSAFRELVEELSHLDIDDEEDEFIFDESCELERVGLIYDPADAVGRVHLGVLQYINIRKDLEDTKHKITSNDEGIKVLGFFPKEYLLTSDEIELEGWSRIALEAL